LFAKQPTDSVFSSNVKQRISLEVQDQANEEASVMIHNGSFKVGQLIRLVSDLVNRYPALLVLEVRGSVVSHPQRNFYLVLDGEHKHVIDDLDYYEVISAAA